MTIPAEAIEAGAMAILYNVPLRYGMTITAAHKYSEYCLTAALAALEQAGMVLVRTSDLEHTLSLLRESDSSVHALHGVMIAAAQHGENVQTTENPKP